MLIRDHSIQKSFSIFGSFIETEEVGTLPKTTKDPRIVGWTTLRGTRKPQLPTRNLLIYEERQVYLHSLTQLHLFNQKLIQITGRPLPSLDLDLMDGIPTLILDVSYLTILEEANHAKTEKKFLTSFSYLKKNKKGNFHDKEEKIKEFSIGLPIIKPAAS